MNRPMWVAALAAAVTLPAPVAAQAQDHLRLEQCLDWEGVGGPELSPDGTQIIYTRSWVDQVNDRRESSVWIMNADGSRNRFLVDGSSPTWSPDGTRIAYTASGEPDGPQIWGRGMDAEGAATQPTRVEDATRPIAWAAGEAPRARTMAVGRHGPRGGGVRRQRAVLRRGGAGQVRAGVEQQVSQEPRVSVRRGMRGRQLCSSTKS